MAPSKIPRIALEGCIGSGKTTTARLLAQRLKVECLEEQSDRHPFLEAFYSDVTKYALETELAFLLIHFHQLHHQPEHRGFVSDFTIEKDVLFAAMNLREAEAKAFENLYSFLSARLAPPSLTLILDVPTDVLLHRIQRRGRPFERSIPELYLERLKEGYRNGCGKLWKAACVLPLGGNESADEVAERAYQLCTESCSVEAER